MTNPRYFAQAQEIAVAFMAEHKEIKGDPTPLAWSDPQDGMMTVILTAGPKVTAEVPKKTTQPKSNG